MNNEIVSGSSCTNRQFKRLSLDQQLDVEGIEFYDCIFEECSLVESVLRRCRFVDCLFDRCDLSLTQFAGSRFSATRFVDSKLVGINWTLAEWSTSQLSFPVSFHGCAINYATFIGLSLSKIEIIDCTALDVDFREADLSKVDFTGTDLAQSRFGNTNLTCADFSQARNYHIDPGQNNVKQAKFSLPEAMSLLYSLDIVLINKDL